MQEDERVKGLEPKLPLTKAHAVHWFRSRARVTAYPRSEGEKKPHSTGGGLDFLLQALLPATSEGREKKKKARARAI